MYIHKNAPDMSPSHPYVLVKILRLILHTHKSNPFFLNIKNTKRKIKYKKEKMQIHKMFTLAFLTQTF